MVRSAILVVDDSEIDQFIAKHMLNKHAPDIDVLQAFDGLEALEILSHLPQPPILILLDINMPRMNGHDFLQEFEALHLNSVPIIMLTSSFQVDERDRCLQYKSVKKFLTKPLEDEIMNSVFEEILPQ